jgi:hypothetical protein
MKFIGWIPIRIGWLAIALAIPPTRAQRWERTHFSIPPATSFHSTSFSTS